jgi:enoyl-CoA hydratase/carnithine racemase
MTSANDFITVDRSAGAVWLVTLNRPQKLNALSKQLLGQLASVLAEAEADPSLRCVILTGAGRAFSAGADVNEFISGGIAAYLDTDRLRCLAVIANFPKPLIAAVNGYALGGGCELAMACDIVIASDSAVFGQPEARLGSFPGDGGTQRLPRAVGKSFAMQMILTCEPITAEQAVQHGLASETVPAVQLLARAREVAEQICGVSPTALRFAKKAVLAAFELPLGVGLQEEQKLIIQSCETDDRREGLRAFQEKRKPMFEGR